MANWWDSDPIYEPPPQQAQQPEQQQKWWDNDPIYQPPEQAAPPQTPQEPQPEGMLATGVRSFAHNVLPGIASIPAFVAGSATPAGPVGGLAAGAAAFYGAHKLQESALNAMGFDDSQQQAVNARENPWSSFGGELASAATSFGAGPAKLATRVIGGIAGGGLETINQTLGGQELDPGRIAAATAAGTVMTRPRALTEALGSRTAQALGRPELWHGAAGPDAAAGTSKEQPPPRTTPDATAELPTDYYAKPPRVTEVEPPPAAAGEPAPRVIEGEAPPAAQAAPAPQVTPVDPAIDAAINKRPIEPRVTEVEPPTKYGQMLDEEFPRVPQPQVIEGEAPLAAARGPEPRITPVEEPAMENLARSPREAMEQKAPDETYGQVLRRLASDERGGGRIPRKPPVEEPAAETLPKELAGAKPRYAYGSKQFTPEFASDIDKALFITAQAKKSTSDAKYRDWLTERGFSDEDITRLGQQVRNEIKVQAAGALEGGRLFIDPIARRAAPAAEAMPTPRVIEGEAIPDAAAKADAALTARGFTPEQIAKMKPKAKEAILQKREGEVGSKPPDLTDVSTEWLQDRLRKRNTPERQKLYEQELERRQAEKIAPRPAPGEAPATEALDRTLANRMLNQPAILKSEAAKRGITPEALKAQATEALKTAPEAPLPGKPAQMSPVGGETPTTPITPTTPTKPGKTAKTAAAAPVKVAPIPTETPEYRLARQILSDPAVLRAQAKERGMTIKALSNEALEQVRVAETTPKPAQTAAAAPPGKPPKPPTVGQAAAAAGGTPPPPPSGPTSMVYAPRQKRSDLGDLVRSIKLQVGGDIGPIGRMATESIRKSYGNLNRVYEQGQALLERHREQVFNTSEPDRWKIVNRMEGGNQYAGWQPTPEQRTLINDNKSVMDHWKEQLQGLDRTKQMEFVDNYLAHMYENPDQARDFFNSWGKRGGAGSTKKRTMPTYQDAIDAGLKPLTSDPIEIAQRYGLSMKHFIASNEVLERAVNTGVAGYFKAGKSIGASGSPSPLQVGGPPPGWKRLNAPPNKQGHELYAPEDYADKYNKFYDKGFFGGTAAPIYNAARNANSAWTSLELGLNPYHFFTMVNEGLITDIAKGFDQMFSGQFKQGMQSIIKSPLAGRTRYVNGRRLQQEYLNPNSTDPIASVLAEANARPIGRGHALDVLGSPNDPRTPTRGSFLKNFSSENINFEVRKAIEEFKQDFDKAGTSYERVKFAGKQMSRMLQTVGAPIFDKYIPALKAGALHSHMEAWFEANSHIDPRNMTPEQRQLAVKAAIKYTDTIDNRFGEMIHDNTFMNKTMQQAATVLMRSFSWTVGAMREIAGGTVAGAKAFSALGRGENKFSMRHPEYDPRISYVAALGAGVSITSAIYQYLHTGELPQDINDLYAPRTGGTVPGLGGKGEVPEHVLMPGFHKDVYGWLMHPLSEAYAKSSGLTSTAYEQLTNEDWRGDPIYRRGADPIEHMQQRASHLFSRFGPISIKNMIKGQPDTSGISSVETTLGFRAPGAAIQDPKQLENWMRVKSEREWEAKQRHGRTEAKKYERVPNAASQ